MPLHRWPGGSLHPARRGVWRVLVLGGDGDGGEEEPVSRRPANRDRRHVLQESARSRFDRHVVDHPGTLQNVRHRAAIVTDSEERGGGPRELDIRAFQTGRRIRASERADDRLLNRPIGTFLCVSRRLDLDRGRRGFRVPWQADDDRQPTRTLAFQHLHVVRNFLVCREDRHGACGQRLAPAGVVHVVDLPVDQVDDDLLGLVAMPPELRARGGHRLGEPFERQPRSLLSTREQQARGLVRCIHFPMGDIDASDKTTSLLFPSREQAPWLPFERFAETMTTSRTKLGRHPHQAEEVVIYLVDGEVDHVDDSGRREALTAGSVAVLTAHQEISHDMEMLRGKRARWLSVVVRLPWHTEPPPTAVQIKTAGDAKEGSDGTVQKPVVGPLARADASSGLECTDIEFARTATGFFRIGHNRRAVAYVLEGSGMIDDVPIKSGSGALLENMSAVAIGGSPGYRLLLASVPIPAEHQDAPDAPPRRVK